MYNIGMSIIDHSDTQYPGTNQEVARRWEEELREEEARLQEEGRRRKLARLVKETVPTAKVPVISTCIQLWANACEY